MLRARFPPSSVDRPGYVTPADLPDHTHPHHHQHQLFAWLTAKSLPGPRCPKIANQPAQLALPFEAYHLGWRHPSILRVAFSLMGNGWRTVSARLRARDDDRSSSSARTGGAILDHRGIRHWAAADRRSSRRDHPQVESAHAARPLIAGHVRRAVSVRVVSRTHPGCGFTGLFPNLLEDRRSPHDTKAAGCRNLAHRPPAPSPGPRHRCSFRRWCGPKASPVYATPQYARRERP